MDTSGVHRGIAILDLDQLAVHDRSFAAIRSKASAASRHCP
jgi:hypothetical protein